MKEISGVVVMTAPVPQQYQPCLLGIDPTLRPAGDMATAAGSWQSISAGAGVRVTYAANAHFDDGAVKLDYYVSNSGLIYDVASHFVGSGTYRVDGDRMAMTGHGATRTMLFSVRAPAES